MAMGNCYVAICSATESASAPTWDERGGAAGHTVAAASLQFILHYTIMCLKRNVHIFE